GRARLEEAIGNIYPAGSSKGLIRAPDAATCGRHPERATVKSTVRRDLKCRDAAGSDVLAAVPVQECRVDGILRPEREPRCRRIFAAADTLLLDCAEGRSCTADLSSRDLVTAIQLVILVGPRRRALACRANL